MAVGLMHVLAVEIADARRADRSLERNARQRQSCRRADHRRDVGIDFGIDRQHVDDHLDFVKEAIGKQRTDRTVDQPGSQRLLLRGAAFALEEAARDAPCRVGLLDVVDGQREEVLAGLGFLAGNDGGQHHGVVHRADDRAAGLACNFTRLERHGMRAVRELLRYLFEHLAFLSCLFRCGRSTISAQRPGTPRYRRLGAGKPPLRPYRSAHVAGQRQTARVDHSTQAG